MKKTLYKKDSKNKIRIWIIEVNGDNLIEYSGLKDGKLIVNSKLCKPKNVGKSNETSGVQQAKLELESRYLNKLDEGYFKTIKEAKNNEILLPMLAKNYSDHKHKIDWDNCYVQPKLDGQRAIDDGEKLISRNGKIIDTVKHIGSLLKYIPFKLDGELYIHGLSFQENMELIKKYRPGETEKISYHVYDIIHNEPFYKRYEILSSYKFDGKYIKIVPTYKITSEKELNKYHQQFLFEGYEGSIVRWGNDNYKINGRSENLLKYKDFQDVIAKIIDIEPAKQKPEWGVPVLEYNGKTFRAGTKMSHNQRIDLLNNSIEYINKNAEIRFFEYTNDGLPRFPVMVGIRLDK